jgi:MFS family permease
VLGALGFGWLTDRLGRRKLFFVTLTLYLTATAATGLSWNLASFAFFRFLTGAGIGGEYAAINSTIQEFTPARVRGFTDPLLAKPTSAFEKCRTGLAFNALATAPASVTSSPSSSHVMPSATTTSE